MSVLEVALEGKILILTIVVYIRNFIETILRRYTRDRVTWRVRTSRAGTTVPRRRAINSHQEMMRAFYAPTYLLFESLILVNGFLFWRIFRFTVCMKHAFQCSKQYSIIKY